VKHFSIDPNAGFLRPATSLDLTLLLQIHEPFTAKVQVVYSQLVDYSYSFEQAWTKIKELKLPIYSEIIQIELAEEKQQAEEVSKYELHPLRNT
jgi:primosomal protein N'